MIDSDLLLALCEARAGDRRVEIVVTDCLYACCARPPLRRAGYEQTYRGVVAHIDERQLVLHALALGSLNYHVVAELENIEDVAVLADEGA